MVFHQRTIVVSPGLEIGFAMTGSWSDDPLFTPELHCTSCSLYPSKPKLNPFHHSKRLSNSLGIVNNYFIYPIFIYFFTVFVYKQAPLQEVNDDHSSALKNNKKLLLVK